jgi:small-conductance mechanosensitive channel
MAERQSWPAWRYGPNGEAKIFASAGDVPEGWGKQPQQPAPAAEQQAKSPGDDEVVVALRAESNSLRDALDFQHAERDRLNAENDQLRERNGELREEVNRLRAENARLKEKVAAGTPLPQREQSETSVRRPRKLNAKEVAGTPFTPQDETITVDEGRAERLKVLREAGITISDDATDGDIEEALDWLEKQGQG